MSRPGAKAPSRVSAQTYPRPLTHARLGTTPMKGRRKNLTDLGRGKRMMVRGGSLETQFDITVPEELHAGD